MTNDEIAEALIQAGHQLHGSGRPDDFAFYAEPGEDTWIGHNGFWCDSCLRSFCVHCIRSGLDEIEACPNKDRGEKLL